MLFNWIVTSQNANHLGPILRPKLGQANFEASPGFIACLPLGLKNVTVGVLPDKSSINAEMKV